MQNSNNSSQQAEIILINISCNSNRTETCTVQCSCCTMGKYGAIYRMGEIVETKNNTNYKHLISKLTTFSI